jgi:hypothetical protein
MIQDAGWIGGQHRMVRPLSIDLRQRVVVAVSKGESFWSAAARFGVAVSSVVKWSQRYRATGSVKPVLGDAEQIVGLTPVVNAGVEHATVPDGLCGSIDTPAIKKMIKYLLEGGQEAIEFCKQKYRF